MHSLQGMESRNREIYTAANCLCVFYFAHVGVAVEPT